MTGEQFTAWLKAMKDAGKVKSEAEAGRMLGFNAPNSMTNCKRRGVGRVVALACQALMQGFEEWPDPNLEQTP